MKAVRRSLATLRAFVRAGEICETGDCGGKSDRDRKALENTDLAGLATPTSGERSAGPARSTLGRDTEMSGGGR